MTGAIIHNVPRDSGRRIQEAAEMTHTVETRIGELETLLVSSLTRDPLISGDRSALGEYLESVLRASPYPSGFPVDRKAGYFPESSSLAVEWRLPPPEIVPANKRYKYVKAHDVVRPTAR